MKQKITKIALITDIHFGAKGNSKQHNQDCLHFTNWFCDMVRNDPDIDAIGFLGDWNENRSALDISTLTYSYRAAKKINNLGVPVFFVIGNHDLYYRHTREIHSIIPFNEFTNFKIIEEPTVMTNPGGEDVLFCPFMFHNEYPTLTQYLNVPLWMGHFEFKGFEVTGSGIKMPIGPEPSLFKGPKYILSGHFHKRQVRKNSNIIYIGNTFPTTYGDAGDIKRGMATYDFSKHKLQFYDWSDCPRYTKTTLSKLIDGLEELHDQARVKCLADIPISFEESNLLKKQYIKDYNLREFILEESPEIDEAFSDTETNVADTKLASVDDMVRSMLTDIETIHIKNEILLDIYNNL